MSPDPIVRAWNLNLAYAKRLVADIPDDRMAFQPAAGMNHPAWVLGHLACTADVLGAMLGSQPVCPPEWHPLFDWNSSPSADATLYPSKQTLLAALEAGHERLASALPGLPSTRWTEPTPTEAIRAILPTLGDCCVFIMAAHENIHLGQLSAWRRVQGMARV
jgi:DinB superfamily